MGDFILQVLQAQVEGRGDGLLCRAVRFWYANWNGSSDGGSLEVMWSFTSLSKHFIMMEVSATGRRSGFLRHWYDGGKLETGWDNSLNQRGVKEVGEAIHRHL